LAQLLKQQKRLTSIKMINCEFNNDDMYSGGNFILDLLDPIYSIRTCIIENSLNDHGAIETLIEYIQKSRSLSTFYIKKEAEEIADQSIMIKLLVVLAKHPFLNDVTLLSNGLFHLNINHPNENKKALDELTKLLVNNKSIECLEISSTNPYELQYFDKEFIDAIQNALKFNTTLNSYTLFSISAKNIIYDKDFRMNLKNSSLNDEAIRDLCFTLTPKNKVTSLNLSYNSIYRSTYLTKLLFRNDQITSLDLSHNVINNMGTKHLCQGVQSNTKLQFLNLAYNQMSQESARHLTKMLEINSNLTSLNLEGNSIASGFPSIIKGLIRNSTLKSLNVRHNDINFEQGSYLSQFLRINTTLTHLDFSLNYIALENAKYWAQNLVYNQSLISIDLNNSIEKPGIMEFAKNFRLNFTTLQSINFEGNAAVEKKSSLLQRMPLLKFTFFNQSHPDRSLGAEEILACHTWL
jgi:hypothetical protein